MLFSCRMPKTYNIHVYASYLVLNGTRALYTIFVTENVRKSTDTNLSLNLDKLGLI